MTCRRYASGSSAWVFAARFGLLAIILASKAEEGLRVVGIGINCFLDRARCESSLTKINGLSRTQSVPFSGPNAFGGFSCKSVALTNPGGGAGSNRGQATTYVELAFESGRWSPLWQLEFSREAPCPVGPVPNRLGRIRGHATNDPTIRRCRPEFPTKSER
jgi:hypothetical protein